MQRQQNRDITTARAKVAREKSEKMLITEMILAKAAPKATESGERCPA
jgi:hypothetical protein